MRVLRCTKIMWKTQVTSSILLSILFNHLCADSLQETKEENSPDNGKISRSILGGPFLNAPLVLSLGYGLIQEKRTPKPQQMKGTFVVLRRAPPAIRFHRPRISTFARPIPQTSFRNWGPPLGNRESLPRMPLTYIVSQPPDFGYDAQKSIADSPEIELYKSDSFTLPPEVTVFHPTNYAKDYLIDEPSDDVINKELLIGEERRTNDNDGDASEIMVDGNTGIIPRDQYFQGNRRPLVFDSHPRNIYEVISAERLSPKNLEVMVEKNRNSKVNAVEATDDVLKVKAVDGEAGLVAEGEVEEDGDGTSVEKGSGSGGCEENVNEDDENIDLRVEKLAERRSLDGHADEMKSRLDVVVIGQQICR